MSWTISTTPVAADGRGGRWKELHCKACRWTRQVRAIDAREEREHHSLLRTHIAAVKRRRALQAKRSRELQQLLGRR